MTPIEQLNAGVLVTVGVFTYDPVTQQISGPAEYFADQGNVLLSAILAGEDVVFNTCAHFSPAPEIAILVRLQTDYAGWHGLHSFIDAYHIR